ncbi:MAG: hypothetical protein LQ350_005509 [Teloschistes chrysophthalmus]|nr:MAG: hypothetical protein LQ350_005509 [Niorma chrysophthalma]
MKKLLSHAFSTKALMEQEDIIQSSIDAFIDKIGPESRTPRGLNVGQWYQMVAFDILGDMAFGESFHCVENALTNGRQAEIYTSAWTVTHDEKYFHEPYVFKPERWIDIGCKDVKEASQPFSLGPRGCLGRNHGKKKEIDQRPAAHIHSFAELEISLILAKILHRYDLEMVNKDLDWEGQSHVHVMWWKPELRVRFLPAAPPFFPSIVKR